MADCALEIENEVVKINESARIDVYKRQALLFGACSNQNEVSQNETEKPVGFVQKEEKAKKERDEQEKIEKEKKAKEEQERKEKEEREKKEAEAKQLADQAEAAVQALENNQVTENIAPAQAAIANVADQGTKDRLTHRVGLVQNLSLIHI